MKYLLCANPEYSECLQIAHRLSGRLSQLGIESIMDESFRTDSAPGTLEFMAEEKCDAMADVIVSIGGDGTMLKVAQRAIALDKPVFGLNAGRIGFLCAFDKEDIEDLTKNDLDSLQLNSRTLLDVYLSSAPESHYAAVNDVVVAKGGLSKTIELTVRCGSKFAGEYRSDGVIVSTSTGSTAYSLSAGGPIIEPSLELIVVTPVCAHSMFSRSMVLDANELITITPSGRNDNAIFVSVDSNYILNLPEGVSVIIGKCPKKLKLLTSNKRDYFSLLDRRIMKGE